jgi:serine/threonine protein kinase/tetratricopeptide (TPR) repeat protein
LASLTAPEVSIAGDPTIARRYVLGELIGSGSSAAVFKATQTTTGQQVAIKVLRPERGGDDPALDEQIERFRRETRLCAELQHPNIVPLIDSGETVDGELYAIFAFVPGWNLADVLAAEGALEPAEAIHLMTQVIDGVSSAHVKGIVHRDLKPGNIMISSTGARRNAQVLDFGLGTVATNPLLWNLRRLTQRGEYLGTPCYSAPEQLRGEPPTLRSDLYSWGLIFLECLTGAPVMGLTSYEIVHGHLSPDPVPIPPALRDRELGWILRRVTEKDVRKRSASAAEILSALQQSAHEDLPSREAIASIPRPASQAAEKATLRSTSELSPIFLVPLARNPNFAAREDLLQQIAESLEESQLLSVVALHGLGGVGKTQLALEYAYRCADQYRMVAWIRAEARETLAADYCAIGTSLGFAETPDMLQRIESVRSWLERNDRWLLVFDNASNPEALRSFLPRTHNGHILVTSRQTSWRGLAASLAVDVLDPDEATEFLLRRTGEADAEAAAQLSEELGGLPLALEEAAAYMEATGRSIETYLPLLRDERKRVLLEGVPTAEASGGLRTTWDLSFREVEREAPQASDLLKLCAYLAPDDIPLELFRLGSKYLPAELAKGVCDEVLFDGYVAALRRYSLVGIHPDCLSIHRLVQLAMRERLTEEERARWAASALRVVERAYPQSTMAGAYQPESGRLLSHALATLSYADPYVGCLEPAGRLLQRSAIYRSVRGELDHACHQLERALELFESASAPNEGQIAVVLWELGMARYALGEADTARERLERSVAIFERVRGAKHPWVAQALMALSWVLRTLGDFEGSYSSAERSLEIMQRALGTDHPVTAMSLSIMASDLWNQNRLAEARQLTERALAVLTNESENLHPFMCGTWNNLAQILLDLGDLERALECADRGLEIGERAWGPAHPFPCISMSVRGSILQHSGDLDGARSSLERALAGAQRAMSHLHADIARSRSELGNVLRRCGDFEGARTILEHALEGGSRVCGDRSCFESHARVAFASLLRELGDLPAARKQCESGLRILADRFGADHPRRIAGLNTLGWILHDMGEPQQARCCFDQAIEISESAGLLDHFEHAESIEGVRSCGEVSRCRT